MVINGKANRKAISDLRRTNELRLVRLPVALKRTSPATASAIQPLSSRSRRPLGELPAALGRYYPDSGSVACTLPQPCENASTILSWLLRAGLGVPDQPSALGEFQFDATIAAIGVLAGGGVERLVVGKTGRNKPAWRDALADRVAHHRDCPRRRQFPVRRKLCGADRPAIGVAVDPEDPADVCRDLL